MDGLQANTEKNEGNSVWCYWVESVLTCCGSVELEQIPGTIGAPTGNVFVISPLISVSACSAKSSSFASADAAKPILQRTFHPDQCKQSNVIVRIKDIHQCQPVEPSPSHISTHNYMRRGWVNALNPLLRKVISILKAIDGLYTLEAQQQHQRVTPHLILPFSCFAN